MENPNESRYIKRTQKDYTMSFKLQIVQEKEPTYQACYKYGIQARSTALEWLKNW